MDIPVLFHVRLNAGGNQGRLNQLKGFSDVRTLLKQLQSNGQNLWFNLSIFGVGAGAAIGAIINQINEQNLEELELDEGLAETEDLLAA